MNRQQENIMDSFRQFYDELGFSETQLKWSPNPHNMLITGTSDFSSLNKLKNVILSLRKDWGAEVTGGIQLSNKNYQQRLLLAESEIEGLLKRKINYSFKDAHGERVLDYTSLLNEKQNQIIELQKKVQNIESKLRKTCLRQSQLQNHVVILTEELKRKQDIINLKHDSAVAEVAISTALLEAVNKLRKNVQYNKYRIGEAEKFIFQGVTFPEIGNFDIKPAVFSNKVQKNRSQVYQQASENQKYKIRLVQFFRQFERLSNQSQDICDFQVQRIIEGFLNNMPQTKLYEKMRFSIEKYRFSQNFTRLRQNFSIAAGIFSNFINQIQKDNMSYKLPLEVQNIFELLRKDNVEAVLVENGAVFINIGSENPSKVVEVPVQDAKTKHLIHLLAHSLKSIFLKYPKIQGEVDARLAEFLEQQIIDLIEVDEIQKLIQIVKFVPQIVKVENVYVHSTTKEKKMQFHLRVLIKALLQQLQKIKIRTGATLQMDEGVIGMIRAQIMDVVNVDDILKVFRVTPKIVQVEKIIQKIVQRIVEVPKVITIEKIVEKIVEFERIKQVDKIIYIPIEKPLIVETQIEKLVPFESKIQTIVQVPTIVQKFIELQKQVPKIIEIQVFRDKIVEVEKVIEIERIINHIQTQYQEIEIILEKIVQVEKIVEKVIEVPIYVEKIIEKIIQIPKIIEVEKVVEKIISVIEYRSAREVQNHIQVKYEVIDRIVEKIVPMIQIRERIKEVPQLIEVIKQVNNIIVEIKEVEVIREKIVYVDRIKEVVRVETKLVEVEKEVIKEVERYIQIPIIRQVAVIRELIVQKPVISRIQSVHIKQVILRQPFIIREPIIVEVQKYINVYVEVPKIIKYIEQKIVEVPTIVDRIKEVPVIIEKIIEKMVEVPKVVQVEKIVQKIVVIPRVIQKVVQVPQFIQKIIEKEMIKEVIRQVERIVHVPVIQQQIKEIEVIKNIYIQIQKIVQKIVEKTIQVAKIEEKIITKEILREVPINIIHQVPKEIEVQKIVHQIIEIIKPIEVERQIIVPYQIPIPVDRIIEKIVPKQQIIERIIPTPQIIEKIIPVIQQVIQITQIDRIVEKIVIEKSIQQVEKIIPYINQVIKEVPVMIQKLVYIESKVEQIVIAQQIIEKVIQKTITIPQIYQVERIREKLVQVPKLIQIEKIVPQIIRVNQFIQKIVEKIVEIPIIIETMKEVIRQQEKIVTIRSETTEIVEVQRFVQKLVYAEKLKEVVRNVNYIEKVLQVIERFEQIPYAVTTVEEKFIEVPFILQKIVEKIVIMPQIVQVLKYVHEVCQMESPGVCVDLEVGAHEAKYKVLTKNIQSHLDIVLKQLRYLKSDQAARNRIETIQKFLEELRKFILFPRIVKVVEQKIVQKQILVDRIVKIPIQDQRSVKMELSLSILVQKLIAELKRIKQVNQVNIELDDDIRLIFFADIQGTVNLNSDFQAKLKNYTSYIQRHFESLGSWTTDHQFMLNSFLQERFLMAELIQNANLQIQQVKATSDQRMEGLKKYRNQSTTFSNFLNTISVSVSRNMISSQISSVIQQYNKYKRTPISFELTHYLSDISIDSDRVQSLLRQKQSEIIMLRDNLLQSQQKSHNQHSIEYDGVITTLNGQIEALRRQNIVLVKSSQSGLVQSYRKQVTQLQNRNLQLEAQISRLKSEVYNQSNEVKLLMQNVSFRRQPQASVHQVDLGQIKGRNRALSSQGLSLSGSQTQQKISVGDFVNSVYVPESENIDSSFQNIGIQSATRPFSISRNTMAQNQANQAGNANKGLSWYNRVSGDESSIQRAQIIYGQRSQIIPSHSQNLYRSRHETSQSLIPTTQTGYNQDQSRLMRSGIGSQRSYEQQASYPQSTILNTPIENMKYRSPSPTGIKLAESILKQQESLSKLSAQSPQSSRKHQTSSSGIKYYYGQGKK